MINTNNFASKTNWIAGSPAFKNLPFFLTSVNIPGLTFNHPDIYGTAGKILLTADTVNFNDLSFEMLIDENFTIYFEFINNILTKINPEDRSFEEFSFDFWIEVNNNRGHKIFKYEFYNCKISSIGDIVLDTQSEETEHLLSVDLRYDYFKIFPFESN